MILRIRIHFHTQKWNAGLTIYKQPTLKVGYIMKHRCRWTGWYGLSSDPIKVGKLIANDVIAVRQPRTHDNCWITLRFRLKSINVTAVWYCLETRPRKAVLRRHSASKRVHDLA